MSDSTEQLIDGAVERIMDKAHHEVVYGNLSFAPEALELVVREELSTIASKSAEEVQNRIFQEVQRLKTPTDDDGNYIYDPMCQADQLVQEVEHIIFDRTTEEVAKTNGSEEDYSDIPF